MAEDAESVPALHRAARTGRADHRCDDLHALAGFGTACRSGRGSLDQLQRMVGVIGSSLVQRSFAIGLEHGDAGRARQQRSHQLGIG